jgi:hypothetical protein
MLAVVLNKLYKIHEWEINAEVHDYLAEIGINEPVRSELASDPWLTVDAAYAHWTRMRQIDPEVKLGVLIHVLRLHQEPPRDSWGFAITMPDPIGERK